MGEVWFIGKGRIFIVMLVLTVGLGGPDGCIPGEEVLADHVLILNLSFPVPYYLWVAIIIVYVRRK